MIELNEGLVREFLSSNRIENYEIKKIAGDASFRSYYRIFADKKSYILMFAPPSHEDVKPFIKIDEFLISCGFFAPEIIAKNVELGFLLLKDFGDETYNRVLSKNPQEEFLLYKNAADVLLNLHHFASPKDLPIYNHALLFREVMLFVDWYLPLSGKVFDEREKSEFKYLWFKIFDLLSKENQVLVLRDYHADNLMKIPQGVGLLDFQDAVTGSKAYDLVSLLEDARRDVSENVRQKILEYYIEKSACDPDVFLRDYAILSLQRNVKILGIFSRLSKRDNKHHYLDFMPRVRNFVDARLEEKIFSEIKKLIKYDV